MTALTQDRTHSARWTGRMTVGRAAAGAILHAGGLGARNAGGFTVPAANAADLRVVGVTQGPVNNTGGANGAKPVQLLTGVFKLANEATAPVTAANLHRRCYVQDDQTVRGTPGTPGVVAGIVEQVDPDGVWVYVAPEVDPT
jgi:hypothetical protein